VYTFYTPELRRRKILNYPLGDVAMQVAKVSNNSAGLSGTGTTIVRVTPAGQQTLFFNGNPTNQPPPTLGLTTALGVLRGGFVLVGNLPTTDGTPATIQ
jgi:hypothetical protein